MNNLYKTRDYFIEEINENELVKKKHKKAWTALNYIEHLLFLVSVVNECVSFSALASLVRIPRDVLSFVTELKIM